MGLLKWRLRRFWFHLWGPINIRNAGAWLYMIGALIVAITHNPLIFILLVFNTIYYLGKVEGKVDSDYFYMNYMNKVIEDAIAERTKGRD